jgi:hypothetical protein
MWIDFQNVNVTDYLLVTVQKVMRPKLDQIVQYCSLSVDEKMGFGKTELEKSLTLCG